MLPVALQNLGKATSKALLDGALKALPGTQHAAGAWLGRSVCTLEPGAACYAPVEVQPVFGSRIADALDYNDGQPPLEAQRDVVNAFTQFRLNPCATCLSHLQVGGAV